MPLTLPRVQDPTTDRALQLVAQQLNPPVPQAHVTRDAVQSIANNTVVAIEFNTERYDEGSLHDNSTNNTRLTARITGLYATGGNIDWAGNATGVRIALLRVNGTTTICRCEALGSTAVTVLPPLATEYRLTAGDYVELCVFQNSGGALNVALSANYSPEFWMHRVAGFTADTLG